MIRYYFSKLWSEHRPFLLALIFHLSLIWYGFAPDTVMLNTTHDVGAVATAIDFARSLARGDWLSVYLTPQIYPLGFSLLIMPVAALVLGVNLVFHLGEFSSFALYAYHFVGLFYVAARLTTLALFVIGYYFLLKISDYIPVRENIKKIGLYLYLFSPLSLLFSFQERVHLPAALLMVPTFYFGLRFIREKKIIFGVAAAALSGIGAGVVQYGGVIFVGLLAGLAATEFPSGLQRKVLYLISFTAVFLSVFLLIGYPALLVGNLQAILNSTHYSAVAFNGSGLFKIILALWRYETVLFMFFVYGLIRRLRRGDRFIGESLYVILPLLLFILVFGLYGSFYDRQLGGVVTLFILVVVYFWRGDLNKMAANFVLYLLIIINLFFLVSLHTRRPTFVSVYNILSEAARADDIVVDTAGITSYLDAPSMNLTGKYNSEFSEQALFLNGVGGDYRRLPFVLLIVKDKSKIKDIIKNESPRFIIIHQDENKEDISQEYSLLAEIGGRKKLPVLAPIPSLPGRSGWQIWEKVND